MTRAEDRSRNGEVRLGYAVRDLTFTRILRDRAEQWNDKVFLRYIPDGRAFTYRQMDELSNGLAHRLLEQGLAFKDHVAVFMDNSPEQVILYFALLKIGAVIVPINTAAKGDLLAYYINQSDATAIFLGEDYIGEIADIRTRVPALDLAFVEGGFDEVAPVAGLRTHALRPLIVAAPLAPDVGVRFSDWSFLLYTSGTTGASKGCIFSQARSLIGSIVHIETHKASESDVFYVTLPLFHTNALQSAVFTALLAGGSVALTKRFSASRFWDEISDYGVTVTSLLGSMLTIIWTLPEHPKERQHKLRRIGAVPMPTFTTDFQERFNVRLSSGYGLSDYGMPCAFRTDDPPEKYGSAGRVLDGWEIRIVDEDELDVEPGEAGEVLVRSNRRWDTTLGYYKQPEATVAAWRNFWFHTGDRARFDEDGFLWFVDRKKDSIRRRGENVSAYEVEKIILNHPAVADVAAYPVKPDPSDEEIAVSVVLKAGTTATEEELIHHSIAQMAHYMVPRFVELIDEFPRTSTQKIEKFKLAKSMQERLDSVWDREKHGIVVKRGKKVEETGA